MIRECLCAVAVSASVATSVALGTPPEGEVLLVAWGAAVPPDPAASSIGMYSPIDGSYLGDLVPPDDERFTFPNSVAVGPDRLIYVSDSVYDSIFRYRLDGTFLDVFKGPEDGLANLRALHFLNDDLLVSHNPRAPMGVDRTQSGVLRFALDGTQLEPFLEPGWGISVWDIHPFEGGLLINDVTGVSSSTPLRLFDADAGVLDPEVVREVFPTQIADAPTPGNAYLFSFSGRITEFNAAGLVRRFTLPGLRFMGQGLAPLENGELLVSNFNAGVFRYSPQTLAQVGTSRAGFGIFSTITRVEFCDADLWLDGSVDIDDISRFVETYLAQDPIADLAPPEGVIDLADIDAFVDAFIAGCA